MATETINNININEQVSPVFREILYTDMPWQPGVTFNESIIQPGAGVFYANKVLAGNLLEPVLPGGDYSHSEAGTDQVQVTVNNVFNYSEKVRRVTVSQLFNDDTLLSEKVDLVMNKVKQGWQHAMTAAVVDDSTVQGTIAAPGTPNTTVTDDTNIKDHTSDGITILDNEAQVDASFIMVNPTIMGVMRKFAGKEYIPATNEELIRSGVVATWMGLNVIKNNILRPSATAVKYRDNAGVEKTVDLSKVEYIMGRMEDIAGGNSLETADIQKALDFNGVLVQEEVAAGFKVLDGDRVLIKTIL